MSRPPKVKSLVVKRTIVVGTRKTSVSVEAPFWKCLKEIAASGNLTLGELVKGIDSDRQHANLSSAIRLFVLEHYRTLAAEAASARGRRP
jgi:predicted DNA-binding ribbon-helix-helix protein